MHALRFSAFAALLTVFALVGCDNASVDDEVPTADATADEDAAASIAAAVAVNGGGALDMLGAAATDADAQNRGGEDPLFGCTASRAYSFATQTWSQSWQCERGNPDGAFYSLFGRSSAFQFFDADGAPVQFPESAVRQEFELLDGEGLFRRPRFTHELLDIGAELTITDLQQDLVTVNGTSFRSATDTLRTFGGERTLIYDLALTYLDVRGPRHDRWGHNVSGTIEGQYDAVRTFTTRNGTREETISRSFTITFDRDGDATDLVIVIGDRTFRADPITGVVDGLDQD